jgi:hypothetical protein
MPRHVTGLPLAIAFATKRRIGWHHGPLGDATLGSEPSPKFSQLTVDLKQANAEASRRVAAPHMISPVRVLNHSLM